MCDRSCGVINSCSYSYSCFDGNSHSGTCKAACFASDASVLASIEVETPQAACCMWVALYRLVESNNIGAEGSHLLVIRHVFDSFELSS
jgi:hypothetical protein